MDSGIGTEFAGHRIEAVIGRGGASIVYLAEHLRLGRKAALKILAPHLADDDTFRERFIRESRIAAGLDHPNIITVYDAGEVDGSLYISMRYVEGSDLEKLLGEEKVLEPSRAISILSQVASALDAAHAEGLVHRDVKPGNILVDAVVAVPGLDRAYLSDFGISKRTTSRGGLTRTGQFVGTVDYVAPEQITGEPVDGRADVYSLGCVLYRCLCGSVPFPGLTEVATIYSHLRDPPPSLVGAAEAWTGVDRVLAKALSKDKHERYDTCGALIEAARTELIATASAVTDGPPTPTPRSGPAVATANDVDTPETSVDEVETVQREVAGREPAPTIRADGRRRRSVAALSAGAAAVVVLAVLAFVLPQLNDGSNPGSGETSPPASPPTSPTSSPSTGAAPPGGPVHLSWNNVYRLEDVFGGSGKQAILDAVVAGDSVVAVGHAVGLSTGLDDAAVWRSANGQRWNVMGAASLAEEGDQRMIAVTEFEGSLVAAGWDGSDAAVWVSRDEGDTWTPSTSSALGGLGSQLIRDLAPFGTQLIAVGASGTPGGQDAATWISEDGVAWERVAGDGLAASGHQEMWGVRPLGSRIVAIGYTTELGTIDPAVWLYEEGTWSRVDPGDFGEPGVQIMLDIAGGERGLPLVAVGCADEFDNCHTASSSAADAAVWTSDDGRSWERVTTEGGRLDGDGTQVMRAIVTYRGSFVAVGTRSAPRGDLDGGVWTSTDGLEWRAPGPLAFTASDLGGRGDQSLRALVPYGRPGIALLGFGVTDEGEVEDAQVWAATA